MIISYEIDETSSISGREYIHSHIEDLTRVIISDEIYETSSSVVEIYLYTNRGSCTNDHPI